MKLLLTAAQLLYWRINAIDLAEALVGRFLTCNGLAFACHQYTLRQEYGGQKDFDFVVLDFARQHIILVEVSDSGGLGSVGDVHEYETKYLDGLGRQIAMDSKELTAGWKTYFLRFVRSGSVEAARRKFPSARMFFRSIEDAAFDYWDVRQKSLLPDYPQSAL